MTEKMVRISFTLPERLSARIDTHVKFFRGGEGKDNRSEYLVDILSKHVPTIEE